MAYEGIMMRQYSDAPGPAGIYHPGYQYRGACMYGESTWMVSPFHPSHFRVAKAMANVDTLLRGKGGQWQVEGGQIEGVDRAEKCWILEEREP